MAGKIGGKAASPSRAARQGPGGEQRTDKLRGVDQDCEKEARGATARGENSNGTERARIGESQSGIDDCWMLLRVDVYQCVTAVHTQGQHSNDRRRVLTH